MDELELCWASERRRYGERSYQQPSRFLQEIPDELVEVTQSQAQPGGGRRRSSQSDFDEYAQDGPSIDYTYNQEGADEIVIQRGMRVRHPVFGLGNVIAVIGNGLDQKLRIQFDRAGVKTVMLRFANLEPA
jgi:DNA helicase-2/ATP-dependent DNA helicase PcrA